MFCPRLYQIPKKSSNIKFAGHYTQVKAPFFIYADFESIFCISSEN